MRCRFCSLFNPATSLSSALEESRPLLMVGVGCRGMAPLRAVLSWAPVQAHATTQRIALVQVGRGGCGWWVGGVGGWWVGQALVQLLRGG